MIPLEAARARILAGLTPVGHELVALERAHGRVLAVALSARLTQPPAPLSAMDGYAVRAAEACAGARLAVVGESRAGHGFHGDLPAAGAVRVSTGAVVPNGADTVVMQENTTRADGEVVMHEAARPGRHIRAAGQDFQLGETLIPAGSRLTARRLGLAAAANHPWLTVHRRPVVALLATGDELANPGEPVPEGGVVSSNGAMLAALLRAAGATPILLPIVPDDADALAEALSRVAGADLLVTIGGASVGDHDLVRKVMAGQGLHLDFWKVAMRPGKPLIHGRLGAMPVLGLPGNPVSAYVCAVVFLLPALARLAGLRGADAPPGDAPLGDTPLGDTPLGDTLGDTLTPAILGRALGANDQRAEFLRARLTRDASGQWRATPATDQASSLLRVLAEADALIYRPPHAPAAAVGDPVSILRLDLPDP